MEKSTTWYRAVEDKDAESRRGRPDRKFRFGEQNRTNEKEEQERTGVRTYERTNERTNEEG